MKHRIYMAAASDFGYYAADVGRWVVTELGADQAELTSRWHNTEVEKYPKAHHIRVEQLNMNLSAIERSTVMVVLCDAGQPRTTFAEAGYGLGRGLPLVWVRGAVASQWCLFDAHPSCHVIDSAPTAELAKTIARVIETVCGREAA